MPSRCSLLVLIVAAVLVPAVVPAWVLSSFAGALLLWVSVGACGGRGVVCGQSVAVDRRRLLRASMASDCGTKKALGAVCVGGFVAVCQAVRGLPSSPVQ